MRGTFTLAFAALLCGVLPVHGQDGQDGQDSDAAAGGALPIRVVIDPFANLTGAPEDAWLASGIAETLRVDVAASPRFTAVERTDRRAHGAWTVSGAYQRLDDAIRITARVRDEEGRTVATVKLDGARDDLFALQDRLAPGLGLVRMSRAPAAARAPAPTNAAAARRGGTAGFAAGGRLATIVGPPPPLAPAVEARDALGRVTIRAVRVREAIVIDGRLADAVYDEVPSIGGFIQQEPTEGAPASERTEAWIFFDDEAIYIAARCWESRMDRLVANEMRRDNTGIFQNDNFAVVFDTYYDRRNGYMFHTNPLGGLFDMQVTEGRVFNRDWNTVWEVKTGRFDGGWTVEIEIPFKSLRYPPGQEQLWGFNLRRIVRWKNELSYLAPAPASFGPAALLQLSTAGTLVGLEAPPSSTHFELKPYAIADVTTDLSVDVPVRNDPGGDVGLDAKYGITQSLTADFTFNTDFAQVEVDEQQVNLTRFNLFFPEKREFFLEGQGLFEFGGGRSFSGGGRSSFRRGRSATDTPTMFFSRRIGLEAGRVVPIIGGGRVTGKLGPFSLGALTIQTEEVPTVDVASTNFTVIRLKRDILRRSAIGAMFTGRSASTVADGSNQAFGLDGVFSFYDNLDINTYVAKTRTSGLRDDDHSYRAQLDYNGDRYGVQVEQLAVGANFNPEVGFVRRLDFRRSFGSARFSPRPGFEAIRKLSWDASFDYTTDGAGVLETRVAAGVFGIELENGDELLLDHSENYEFLKEPFEIAPGVLIPIGGYDFRNTRWGYAFGPQRWFSADIAFEHGTFFDGDKTAVTISRPRVEVTPQLSLEPAVLLNWVDLTQGTFTTTLVSARTSYTLTPRLFVSALMQYNSSAELFGTNARLRWEYRPGSELFIVYTDERDTASLMPERTSAPRNLGFVVKMNRLFRF